MGSGNMLLFETKYIGQFLVKFWDHTNMPNFHLSSLDRNTTHEKNPKIRVIFFEN